jgi:hypothetical protein
MLLSSFLTITYFNSKRKLNDIKTEMKHKSDSLNSVIDEKEAEIKYLENEIQFREIEVMYWGQKYDSCQNNY